MEMIQEWLDKNLENYLNKKGKFVSFEDDKVELKKDVIDHIVDWMESSDAERHRKRLFRLSVPDAYRLSQLWTRKLHKKYKKNKDKENALNTVNKVLDLKDGYYIVELVDEISYLEEGEKMGHCVGGYHGKDSTIYSLRDKNNNPHCTIEISGKSCYQIKGKANGDILEKYHLYEKDFLNILELDKLPRYDVDKINCYYFGTYLIHNDEKRPEKLFINKNFELKNDQMKHPMNKLEINGDFKINNYKGWRLIADEIVVHGDLLIEDLRGTTRLCNKLKVLGDIEIINTNELRCLSSEMDIQGNVLIEDCEVLLTDKIKCNGELEVA